MMSSKDNCQKGKRINVIPEQVVLGKKPKVQLKSLPINSDSQNQNLGFVKEIAKKVLQEMGDWNSFKNKDKILRIFGHSLKQKEILNVVKQLNALNMLVFILAVYGIKADQSLIQKVVSPRVLFQNRQLLLQLTGSQVLQIHSLYFGQKRGSLDSTLEQAHEVRLFTESREIQQKYELI